MTRRSARRSYAWHELTAHAEQVPCPLCEAPKHSPCVRLDGSLPPVSHFQRVKLADQPDQQPTRHQPSSFAGARTERS